MDELVKQCRDCIDCLCGDCKYEHLQKPGNFVPCMNALLGETANAIEELSRENESLAKSVNEASEILLRRTTGCSYHAPKPITNADRIRAMTDEELAEFITNTDFCELLCLGDAVCKDGRCDKKLLDWLREEVAHD